MWLLDPESGRMEKVREDAKGYRSQFVVCHSIIQNRILKACDFIPFNGYCLEVNQKLSLFN